MKFELGDRVFIIQNSGNLRKGDEGTVIKIDTGLQQSHPYLVEFNLARRYPPKYRSWMSEGILEGKEYKPWSQTDSKEETR